MGTVGIIANPAAGKDIRRLVSSASPTSDMAKIGIVRRAVVGAIEGGADRVLIADDHKSLGRQALRGLEYDDAATSVEIIGDERLARRTDGAGVYWHEQCVPTDDRGNRGRPCCCNCSLG